MSGANKNKPEGLGSPAVYVLSVVISLAVYTLGLLAKDWISIGTILSNLCIMLLTVLFLGSFLAARRMNKKFSAMSVREKNNIADQRRAQMAADMMGEWKKLRRLCVLTWGYVALLWALCLLAIFFYGSSGLGTDWIIMEIVPMFFLSGLLGKAIQPRQKPDDADVLPEGEYPLLYGLVRQAGAEKLTGKKLHIRILHGIPDQECNAAVMLEEDTITLWIGAVLLCVLDEGELKQVLLHEFAHIHQEDTAQNAAVNKVMAYLTADSRSAIGGFADLAFAYPIERIGMESSFFFLFSSREKEGRADHAAAGQGNGEKHCSALAKISAHKLYVFEREPYENIFTSEDIPKDLMTQRAKEFRQALQERAETWKSILEKEIPSRVDTHPTFRQRWEALGCCEYSLIPAETESAFAKECWKAAEAGDREKASIPEEEYARLHKQNYLDHLETIAAYEASEDRLPPEALREPMLAYYRLGMPKKMEAICDAILAQHDSPFSTAFSHYWKGVLLLKRYDRAGLDHIYQAMEANSNYIELGLDHIGSFCTMMGLEEDLMEYRRRAPELMQLKVDRSVGGIHAKAQLTQAQLPEGWQEKILNFIRSAAGDDLQAVYLVKECPTEDYTPSSFVLRFRENTAQERQDAVYDHVFNLLDDWPEDYEFALYIYEPAMEKPLAKVEGSCIYTSA